MAPVEADPEKAIGGEEALYSLAIGLHFQKPHQDALGPSEPSYAALVDHVHGLFRNEAATETVQPLVLCVPQFGTVPLASQHIGFRPFSFTEGDLPNGKGIEVLINITSEWLVSSRQLLNPPAQVLP